MEEPLLAALAEVVADVHAAELVVHARHDVERLVERQVDLALVEDHPVAVHVDLLGLGVDAHPHVGDDVAVDLDVPLGDESLAGAAAADAGAREELLQAGALGVVHVDVGLGGAGALRLLGDGTARIGVTRLVNGTETVLKEAVLAGGYQPGQTIHLKLELTGTGTTSLVAKAWTGETEPATGVTATDGSAELQGPGAIGVVGYASGSATNAPYTVGIDNLSAVRMA